MLAHSHRITIDAPRRDVFIAVATKRGLESWYTPTIEGVAVEGQELTFHFSGKEGPFRWRIVEIKPPELVRWECTEGPGSSIGTGVIFQMTDREAGGTTLDLDHRDLQESDEKGKACNTMWGILMLHLKKYVETRVAEPAFS